MKSIYNTITVAGRGADDRRCKERTVTQQTGATLDMAAVIDYLLTAVTEIEQALKKRWNLERGMPCETRDAKYPHEGRRRLS